MPDAVMAGPMDVPCLVARPRRKRKEQLAHLDRECRSRCARCKPGVDDSCCMSTTGENSSSPPPWPLLSSMVEREALMCLCMIASLDLRCVFTFLQSEELD